MGFYKDALPVSAVEAIIRQRLQPLGEESIPLERALGRIASRDVLATTDEPAFDKSAMDGYAVHESDLGGGVLTLAGESKIGCEPEGSLGPGCAVYVSTGSPLLAGTAAVVPIELCRIVEGSVVIEASAAGRHVVRKGERLCTGQRIVVAGDLIQLGQIALMASQRIQSVEVVRRPTVAFFATGDEIAGSPTGFKVTDAITPVIRAWCHHHSLELLQAGHLPDDPLEIHSALAESEADLVITSGGASVGKKDFTRRAVAKFAEVIVPGVCVKPGSPAFVAVHEGQTFLGLPGNPHAAVHQLELLGSLILGALTSIGS
jgi:molybdopterin molybdotransferase